MVCGHNLPTVVFNYGQSQNNQAMQTTIRNATVITVFLLKKKRWQRQLFERIFHRKQSCTLKERFYYASWQWLIGL